VTEALQSLSEALQSLSPHPEERPLGRVSKDEAGSGASWFETAQERLLTMRKKPIPPSR